MHIEGYLYQGRIDDRRSLLTLLIGICKVLSNLLHLLLNGGHLLFDLILFLLRILLLDTALVGTYLDEELLSLLVGAGSIEHAVS